MGKSIRTFATPISKTIPPLVSITHSGVVIKSNFLDSVPMRVLVTKSHVMIHLFWKPGWELDLERDQINQNAADELERLGIVLWQRLHRASQITRLLLMNGWLGQGAAYDIDFYKGIPIEKAKNELAALGIAPNEVLLEEQEEGENIVH